MPITDSQGQGVSSLAYGDTPDLVVMGQGLLDGLVPRSVMRFASASARAATIAAPVEGMVSYRTDANLLEVYDGSAWVTPPPLVTSTTSGLTAASGFSINSFYALKQGQLVVLDMYLARTGGTINATTGNIPDTACCTVPSGWRPTHQTINSTWDSGSASGGFVMGTDGICTLRTASDDITAGQNLRLHVAFIIA